MLILGDFKSLFPEVFILVDFKQFIMSTLQKYDKFVEVLILGGLTEYGKPLILLALGEKQVGRGARDSNVNAMYTREYSTSLAWRQWGSMRNRAEPRRMYARRTPVQHIFPYVS